MAVARREAQAFVDQKSFLTSGAGLHFAAVAQQVASSFHGAPVPASGIESIVTSTTGRTAAQIAADQIFSQEEQLLSDSLVAMKLLSNSAGGDAAGLAVLAQGYDAIRLAASGRDPVPLRVLAIADVADQSAASPSRRVSPRPAQPAPASTRDATILRDLDQTIDALGALQAADFEAPASTRAPATRTGAERVHQVVARGEGVHPWVVSAAAASTLPKAVQATLAKLNLDVRSRPLTQVLEVLQARKAEEQMKLAEVLVPSPTPVSQFGNAAGPISSSDYVGEPSGSLNFSGGEIRPVGIGDLLMVREHVLRYEGGELAHVENVMKSEHLSRDTRRLERTETTIVQEVETTKEETRDTQTTDRFSLKRETSDTIKTDSSLKLGLSVDAKYGPVVEVKANTEYATSTATESSVKQASEFSKDVVERSVSKLVERILERRSVTTITEFEEKYSHGFDNTAGANHISAFYQWIDKVLQAQIYNYGKRLLFDVTVPEPSTNFILAQTYATNVAQPLEKPPPFTATASDMNPASAVMWAKRYDATGLDAPPPRFKTIAKTIDGVVNQDPYESSKSDTLTIDDGYRAKYASFAWDAWFHPNARWGVLIGTNWMDVLSAPRYYMDMAGEIGSVAFGYEAYGVEAFAATIEIFCELTEQAFEAWQLKVHATITQAYLAKKEAYEQALAQARATAATTVAGRNPEFNQRIVANELRRQCLTLLTGQQFDGFGALELSAEGYAQPNLSRSAVQMPYVRFFEQAFEWEHLVYFFYPYFWGWKTGWRNRMLLDDEDPAFGDFLRAGAARVVFPVRPGFEAAVVHFLETGEIWNGGPPPNIASSLYVPIVQEIEAATGAPGDEKPVGEPWEVRLPTTLVRIRPQDDLPEWQKVGEQWRPVNG